MQTERAAYNANKGKILQAVADLQPDEFVRLRTLTPRESLSLMGISSDDIDKLLTSSGCSAGDLFKQSGNSIVVDTIYHILRKCFINLEEDPGDSKQLF